MQRYKVFFYYANILEKNFNKKLFLFMRIHYIVKILFKNFDLIISILQKFGAIIGVLVKS